MREAAERSCTKFNKAVCNSLKMLSCKSKMIDRENKLLSWRTVWNISVTVFDNTKNGQHWILNLSINHLIPLTVLQKVYYYEITWIDNSV